MYSLKFWFHTQCKPITDSSPLERNAITTRSQGFYIFHCPLRFSAGLFVIIIITISVATWTGRSFCPSSLIQTEIYTETPVPADQFVTPLCTKSPERSLRASRSWKCWSFRYISLMKERYKSQKTRNAEAAITAEAAPPALAIRPLMPFACLHWRSPETSLWWIDWKEVHATSAEQSHRGPVTQFIIQEVNTGPQPHLA